MNVVYFMRKSYFSNFVSSSSKMTSNNTVTNRLSIHSSHIEDIYEVPINIIKRPIPSVLDEQKVVSLMKTYKVYVDN